MCLRRDACSLVSTNLETETVSLARLPDVVRCIHEELCRPVVGSIGQTVYLDATRVVVTCTVHNTSLVATTFSIAADETDAFLSLAVTILHIVYPRRHTTIIRFRSCWQTAIGGVHQGRTFGDVDLDVQRTAEQLTTQVDDGCIEPLAGKDGLGVRLAGCGCRCPSPAVAVIGGAGVGCTALGFRIYLAGNQLSVLVAQIDGTAVAVKLEGCLIALDIVGTQPDDQKTLCRNTAHFTGHLPERQVVLVVTEIHACKIDALISCVV